MVALSRYSALSFPHFQLFFSLRTKITLLKYNFYKKIANSNLILDRFIPKLFLVVQVSDFRIPVVARNLKKRRLIQNLENSLQAKTNHTFFR